MKFLVVAYLSLVIVSCSNNETNSLDALKVKYIDDIAYMMYEQRIDSVAEIITYGGYATAKAKDTFNLYILEDDVVKRRMKSFMCCEYQYLFNERGILYKHSNFSDFYTEYSLDHTVKPNGIDVIEKNTHNDTKYHTYTINNGLLVNRTSSHKVDDSFSENVKYTYNADNKIIKRYSISKNHPSGEYRNKVVLKSYKWNGEVLNQTHIKEFNDDGKDFYETITRFYSFGFPKSKVVVHNKDTICKSIIKILK